jgi:hypothetical protein
MDGYLSNKPDNFVDDPEKLYRLSRRKAHKIRSWILYIQSREMKDHRNLQRNHHLKVLDRIEFHRWEINRKNERSGSYAPRTSSTYQS